MRIKLIVFIVAAIAGLYLGVFIRDRMSTPKPITVAASPPSLAPTIIKPLQLHPAPAEVPKKRTPQGLQGGMFGEPVESTPVVQAPPVAVPPAAIDPLSGVTYTGCASVGNGKLAAVHYGDGSPDGLLQIGDVCQGFTVVDIQPSVLTLKLGSRLRKLALNDTFNAVPLSGGAPTHVLPDPGNVSSYRDKTNQTFYFQVTGRDQGPVWGSRGIYTDDSLLAVAAVHAGILQPGQSGVVRVTMLPGYDHYDGETRNGVTSNAFGPWQGSFRIDR